MPAKGSKLRYGNRDYIFNKAFYENVLVDKHKVELSLDQCKKLIELSNKIIADTVVEENDGFKLPFGLGYVCAGRYKPTYNMIDWSKSNKIGKHVYHLNLHTDGYAVKTYWFRVGRIFNTSFHEVYKFSAYKTLSMAVSKAFGSGKKMYSEWAVSDFLEKGRLENRLNKKYRKEQKE